MANELAPRTPSLYRSILSNETYELIKTMILAHEIAPGVKINIDSLGLKLGVSHTPIREALARLESSGLISKEALKGYMTTNLLTIKEFNDLFQFRLLIEPWAAEQAARNIDAAGKAALNAELTSIKTALKFNDTDQIRSLTDHDANFHTIVAKMSGNSSVANAFEQTHCHLHLFRLYLARKDYLLDHDPKDKFVEVLFKHYYQTGSGRSAIKEHQEIARLIIKKDGKGARAAMRRHIESSLDRFWPAEKELNQE
jgi:DNA-binding GntR family transcriptional regulator